MNTAVLFGVAAVPSVLGLAEVTQQCGLPDRTRPLLCVIFGCLAGIIQAYTLAQNWTTGIVVGVGWGLSAAGLYHGTAATLKPAPTLPQEPSNPPPARVKTSNMRSTSTGQPGAVPVPKTTPDGRDAGGSSDNARTDDSRPLWLD